jgi:TonB family protein
MTTTRKGQSTSKRLHSAGAWLVGIGVVALFVFLAIELIGGQKDRPRRAVPSVVQLKLITPPPPPPPPPKPEEKVVEEKVPTPEMKVDEINERPPSETPDDAPPGPPALDALGEGAGDGFGLAGKPGGSGYGGGGGGGGSRFGWYYGKVRDSVYQAIERRRRLKDQKLEVTAQVWLDGSGRVENVRLLNSTGKSDLDELIIESLRTMAQLDEAPPRDLPQPINVRLGARGRSLRFNG